MGAPVGKIVALADDVCIGEIEITDTSEWIIKKINIKNVNGTHALYLRYEGKDYIDVIEIGFINN